MSGNPTDSSQRATVTAVARENNPPRAGDGENIPETEEPDSLYEHRQSHWY
jgi:hypothetical protein